MSTACQPRLRARSSVACELTAWPALIYARRMATSTVDVSITAGLDHYPIQAGLGIAVVFVAGLIAAAKDAVGAVLTTATLVVTVTWIGIESVVYPHRLGSLGTTWGWIAAGWAMSFLVLALGHRVPFATHRTGNTTVATGSDRRGIDTDLRR